MNELLAAKHVSSFTGLLSAYQQAGVPMRHAIDGGAGSGALSKQMLRYLTGSVYAFEPFEGNHRFFAGADPRIILRKEALADVEGTMAFRVPAVVSEDSEWGRRGMVGYSSGGRLVAEPKATDLIVQAVRADVALPKPYDIDFIKLDLQGGELNALKGMTDFLSDVALMWVEFSGQPGLLDYLGAQGFLLFDTAYLFSGSPTEQARALFDVSRENVTSSNDRTVWFGFKRASWAHFEAEFQQFKHELGLVQTDLACINRRRLDDFLQAVGHL